MGHMGYDGYFLFETTDLPNQKGITVLGKGASYEAGVAMADLLAGWLGMANTITPYFSGGTDFDY